MASTTPDNTSTCLMCFESRTLKVVGRCNHSFCAECLSKVLEGEEEVFQCPTCRSDCPRPWNGVEGLRDFIGDLGQPTELDAETVAATEEEESQGEEEVICEICNHTIKEKVKAVNICLECEHLKICQPCSEKHKTSLATCDHILTPIVSKTCQKASKCDLHNKNLIYFCQTCEIPICYICVSTDHGDHKVERFGDTLRREIGKANTALDETEKKHKELHKLQQELTVLNAMAPHVDKEDMLLQQIEDQAQKVIDKAIIWKEERKQEVRMQYQIIRDIQDDLGKVSEMVNKLQVQINQAREILSKTEHQMVYLEKLSALNKKLEQTAEMGIEVDRRNHRDKLHEVFDEDYRLQAEVPVNLGKIVKGAEKNKKGDFKVKEIFNHTIQADSEDMFIPCVATLGTQSYAVAHPVAEEGLSAAIDIYDCEHPGLLKRTLRDGVLPFHDMSTTPDNKLALLCDGADGTGCRIQVLDPETGNITSLHDIISDGHPIALGVTLLYQYVILSTTDEQETLITDTDKDGTVKHTKRIDENADDINKHRRISCGEKFIFDGGSKSMALYEIQDTGVLGIIEKTSYKSQFDVMGIAVTIWDVPFFVISYMDINDQFLRLYLCKFQDGTATSQQPTPQYQEIIKDPRQGERVGRVATRDGNTIIVSHGRTIRVYRRQ